MSDTNRVGIRVAKSNADEFPVTLAPNQLQALRITGTPSLGFTPNSIQSTEIRSDRQVSDLALVGAEAGGDVGFELSYGTFDSLIESALLGAWVDTPMQNVTAVGAGTVTVASADDFKAGHLIRLSGITGADRGQGVYKVTVKTGLVLTVTPLAGTTALVAANGATSAKVVGIAATADGQFDIAVASGNISVTAPAGTFVDAMGDGVNLAVGQWVKLAGFNEKENAIYFRLTAVSGAALTGLAPTGAVTEATTGQGSVFFGDYVRNGTAALSAHTYVVERRYEDHNPVTREAFRGMVVNGLALSLQPQAIAVGTVTLFGESAKVETATANLYSVLPADLAAPSGNVLNTSSNVGRLGRGANPADQGDKNFVLGADLTLSNNMRRRPAVGKFGSVGTGLGVLSISGTLNTYFDDRTLLRQLLDNQETSFDVSMRDSAGRTILFDLPRIKFSGGAPDVPGQNQDVVLNLPFQALRHLTLGYTGHVQRFSYVA